jgi:hypothetical protein
MITASGASAVPLAEIERLRAAHYNATVAAVVQVQRAGQPLHLIDVRTPAEFQISANGTADAPDAVIMD